MSAASEISFDFRKAGRIPGESEGAFLAHLLGRLDDGAIGEARQSGADAKPLRAGGFQFLQAERCAYQHVDGL